jgi:formylglycine-generating enzyme required for sulfatase activity
LDSDGGDAVGVGFAIAPNHVLTCAHVVNAALGLEQDQPDQPQKELLLDYPLLFLNDPQPDKARVIHWDINQDMAVLQISGTAPNELKPAKLLMGSINVWEHQFRTHGYPTGDSAGVWSTGVLRAKNSQKLLQLVGDENDACHFIQPGYSGAPVWDETLSCVIGMVVASDQTKNLKVAYAIPADSFLGTQLSEKQSPWVVSATDQRVEPGSWHGIQVPEQYTFTTLPGNPHFFRAKDGQLSILCDDQVAGTPFLMDKFATTCLQFSRFLNDIQDRGHVTTEIRDDEYCAICDGVIIAVDCLDRWKKPSANVPWLHAGKPYGLHYANQRWEPLYESAQLPVTLVTWWGARLYSLWAHSKLNFPILENLTYLPDNRQWVTATCWNTEQHKLQRYPWGQDWNRLIVNFSGYKADRNITVAEWNSFWKNNRNLYETARPIKVSELTENTSPLGCVQMIGNVWEWLDGPRGDKMSIRGGCATSAMEYCDPGNQSSTWSANRADEYIGFRCCYPIRRSV